MKSEIVFHGVPQGHNTWGTDDEKYYEGFYNGIDVFSKTRNLFVVEVLRNGPSFSAYYSFIKAYQVTALNGRPGSYFGITLRTDGVYCTNVHSLYNLFEQVFTQMILGHVVEPVGEGLKYRIAKFSDQEMLMRDVKQVLDKNIASYFSDSFEKFDGSFTKDQATVFKYYNLDDTDSESFLNSTKVYGKILISPEYPSRESQLNAFDSKLASLAKELEMEKDARKHAEEAAIAYKRKADSLESQLEASKSSADVKAVANKLEHPLTEMLSLLRSAQGPYLNLGRENEQLKKQVNGLRQKMSSLSTKFYLATGIAAAFLILTCLFGVKAFKSKPAKPGGNYVSQATYKQLEDKYNQLNNQQHSTANLTDILQGYWAASNGSRINIKPDPGKDGSNRNTILVPEQEYTVSLNGIPKNLFDGKGTWSFRGLEVVDADKPDVVKVSVDSGEASVCYVIDGVVVIKRDFVVK